MKIFCRSWTSFFTCLPVYLETFACPLEFKIKFCIMHCKDWPTSRAVGFKTCQGSIMLMLIETLFTCSLLYSTCSACKHVRVCNTCWTTTQYERQYEKKMSLSRHILHCSPTCLFIIFHPRHVAVLLTGHEQTGKTLLTHITLKQGGSTTDLAHSGSVFYSCQVRPRGLTTITCANRSTHARCRLSVIYSKEV